MAQGTRQPRYYWRPNRKPEPQEEPQLQPAPAKPEPERDSEVAPSAVLPRTRQLRPQVAWRPQLNPTQDPVGAKPLTPMASAALVAAAAAAASASDTKAGVPRTSGRPERAWRRLDGGRPAAVPEDSVESREEAPPPAGGSGDSQQGSSSPASGGRGGPEAFSQAVGAPTGRRRRGGCDGPEESPPLSHHDETTPSPPADGRWSSGRGQRWTQEGEGSDGRRYGHGDRQRGPRSGGRRGGYHAMPNLHKVEDTVVHFHKSFGVMQELLDHRDFCTLGPELLTRSARDDPNGVPCARFLDLGCAPGGFSACLLQDHALGPNSGGWGVSLPESAGGFPMAVMHPRLCVQFEDILALRADDLICPNDSVHICVADAQNLSNFFKQKNLQIMYRGINAKSRSLGIWALTVKECELAFSKLRQGGAFVFRFGWRGVGEGSSDVHPSGEKVNPDLLERYLQEEEWYKALTHWLFSILKSLFSVLCPFKSEYVHQADVSFYMVCRDFDRAKYLRHGWEEKLLRAFDALSHCKDGGEIAEGVKQLVSAETKAEIDGLLDYVGRMRAVGIQSRKVTNPQSFESRFGQAVSGDKQDGEKAAKPVAESKQSETEVEEEKPDKERSCITANSDASTSAENGYDSSSASTSQTCTSSSGATQEVVAGPPVETIRAVPQENIRFLRGTGGQDASAPKPPPVDPVPVVAVAETVVPPIAGAQAEGTEAVEAYVQHPHHLGLFPQQLHEQQQAFKSTLVTQTGPGYAPWMQDCMDHTAEAHSHIHDGHPPHQDPWMWSQYRWDSTYLSHLPAQASTLPRLAPAWSLPTCQEGHAPSAASSAPAPDEQTPAEKLSPEDPVVPLLEALLSRTGPPHDGIGDRPAAEEPEKPVKAKGQQAGTGLDAFQHFFAQLTQEPMREPPPAPSAPPPPVEPAADAPPPPESAPPQVVAEGLDVGGCGGGAGREGAAGGASDSESSECGGRRSQFRHSKRAGRIVRQRHMNGAPERSRPSADARPPRRSGRGGGSRVANAEYPAPSRGAIILLSFIRFGLFCAMAWSMNSIIFSIMRLFERDA